MLYRCSCQTIMRWLLVHSLASTELDASIMCTRSSYVLSSRMRGGALSMLGPSRQARHLQGKGGGKGSGKMHNTMATRPARRRRRRRTRAAAMSPIVQVSSVPSRKHVVTPAPSPALSSLPASAPSGGSAVLQDPCDVRADAGPRPTIAPQRPPVQRGAAHCQVLGGQRSRPAAPAALREGVHLASVAGQAGGGPCRQEPAVRPPHPRVPRVPLGRDQRDGPGRELAEAQSPPRGRPSGTASASAPSDLFRRVAPAAEVHSRLR
jgi:hypothetical protein